ncbi:hypothetical protein L3X38_042422 [Prunus dulcis]|uniref:Uncharacterized protein n=1 Tax=Prunus dulcis TaxID=3755 RepID=A0AAD4UV67_PRUDU|nr:hypothetical protein L3X38_042422 [Prunus dulcis]
MLTPSPPLKPYVPPIPFPLTLKKNKIDEQSSNFLETFKKMADKSITYSDGIIEDVLVKVDTLIFSTDFLVLDMEEDSEKQLILGRSFLITGRPLIDVEEGLLTVRIGNEKATFKVCEPITFHGKAKENETLSHLLVHASISKVDKPRVPESTLYLDELKPYDPGRKELEEL